MYSMIRSLSASDSAVYPIKNNGYLLVRNFHIIKNKCDMFGKSFCLNYDLECALLGSLNDRDNQSNVGLTLKQALKELFNNHNTGVLIAEGKSLGVMLYDGKYYFTASHSCGPKGAQAKTAGKPCVIQCVNIDEFVRINKRATGSRSNQFTLNYIDAYPSNLSVQVNAAQIEPLSIQIMEAEETVRCNSEPQLFPENRTSPDLPLITSQNIPLQTSVMAPIDVVQPNVAEFEVS